MSTNEEPLPLDVEGEGSEAERFMACALELARKGLGRTHPNPSVGCVIVSEGKIVAQGYHTKAGQPHAEIEALRRLSEDPARCELYVTLEPCCIHGRTPPCTEAILKAGFKRVFIGSRDPDPRVDGRGAELLRAAGVEVIEGVLRAQCDALLMPFAKRVITGLPWVVAKWAMSLDGKIATAQHSSSWITGDESRQAVHQLRDRLDAIMVGANTLRHDDPRLTCREEGGRDPVRVVIDPRLEVGPSAKVYDASSPARVITFISEAAPEAARQRFEALAPRVELVALAPDPHTGWLSAEAILRALAARGCNSVLVEGGGALLGSLFDARLIDEVYAFIAPSLMGGQGAISPIGGHGVDLASEASRLEQVVVERYGQDVCVRGLVPQEQRAYPISAWLDRR